MFLKSYPINYGLWDISTIIIFNNVVEVYMDIHSSKKKMYIIFSFLPYEGCFIAHVLYLLFKNQEEMQFYIS